jgi:hypothetical protein
MTPREAAPTARPDQATPRPWKQDGHRIRAWQGIIAECLTPQRGGTFDVMDNASLIVAAVNAYDPEALARLTAERDEARAEAEDWRNQARGGFPAHPSRVERERFSWEVKP